MKANQITQMLIDSLLDAIENESVVIQFGEDFVPVDAAKLQVETLEPNDDRFLIKYEGREFYVTVVRTK